MKLSPAQAIAVGIVAVVIYVFQLECPIEPDDFEMPDPPTLEENNLLAGAELMFRNQVPGPEAFAFKGDVMYSGLSDGRIVRIEMQSDYPQVETLMFVGDPQKALPLPCGTMQTEPLCGRPLGMAFAPDGKLIVADAYHGLLSINVDTRKVKSLAKKPKKKGKGHKPQRFGFPNSVAVHSSGDIYFTDSSLFQRRHAFYAVIQAKPDGQLLKYDAAKKKAVILADGLHFPNGILIAKDESYLLFAETTRARIMKYHLTGEKAGSTDVFMDNLPGLPDNLVWNDETRSSFWVGCHSPRGKPHFSLLDFVANKAWLRVLITKLLPYEWFLSLASRYGLLLHVDVEAGSILSAPQDPNGGMFSLSEGHPHNGYLYMGSFDPKFNFVARKKLADL